MNKIINVDNINNAQNKTIYKFFPKNKNELQEIIKLQIKQFGDKVDLNNIDVSNITDMSKLFYISFFNGNISKWDVSNVTNMSSMFYRSKFNENISEWDVSNVTNMSSMFEKSKFNGDIFKWNVSNVENMF